MRKDVVTSLIAVVVFTIVLGVGYPLLVTGISQATMKGRADGSLIHRDGEVVGSKLLGQDFRRPVKNPDGSVKKDADGEDVLAADPRYFQSRPSATGYSGSATYFSNLGPNGKDTRDTIEGYADAYLSLERPHDRSLTVADLPVDAVTDSGSGVDPQISEENARIQARRIAAVRRLSPGRVAQLIDEHTDGRGLGVLGEPGVNVLQLNLALDRAAPVAAHAPSTATSGGTR